MKSFLTTFLFVVLICSSAFSQAVESIDDAEIFATRGQGVVTQTQFSARASKIPEDVRRSALRDPNRVRDLLNTMLLRAQLTADAREAGFDKDQLVIERMRLAAEAELGQAWIDHYVSTQPEPDYEALARENYQLNQDRLISSPQIDVSHILVSTENRSETEAAELANSIVQEVKTDPEAFDSLVLKYSDDPSASSNKGKFLGVEKGQMVKPFEDAAFALPVGGISDPVKTQYGFHIIRLDADIPGTRMSFAEVKPRLIKAEQEKHEARIQEVYLGSLTSLEVLMTKESLEEMVRRQFGENYSDPQQDSE